MVIERKVPGNFNALYDTAARVARGGLAIAARAEQLAVSRLSQAVPELAVDYDEATQNPVRVSSQRPEGRLSAAAASPEAAARRFVKEQADLWQLDQADVGTVEVIAVSRQGLPTVRMVQKVEGVEVFQSDVTAAVASTNEVVSLAGQLFSGAAAAAPSRTRAMRTTAAETSDLSVEAAIAKAAFDLTGHPYKPADFKPARAARGRVDEGPYRFYESRWRTGAARRASARQAEATAPRFERPVRVKDVLFPLGEAQFIPAYYIELWIEDYPAFSYVVDAVDTPDILFRKNLTSSIAFRYRVHNTGDSIFRPEDGPAPGTPHPTGRPDHFQAPTIPEKLIDIESLLPGRPWLPPNAKITRGNNCIAFGDLRSPDGPNAGDVDGKVTAPRTFDTSYDHGKLATDPANLQNSIVGMFFHVNWLHDRWYEAGFDEASGNAQQDNFGLGGLGGDPILAEGNHFSGTDNANMSTPPDGASPRMRMFVFNGPNPQPSRTSNHEALITFHEMGHYITNRLVGNALGLMNAQGGAMGEGWGDFFAICMTSQASDDFTKGTFAVGGWTDVRPGFEDNYYYSIRRYPYSADLQKNPLTFKHISANVVLPVGPLRNPTAGGPNQEVHNAGEVWCCALWEVFVNLVVEHGHVEAERRVLRYVIGGMKLTPANPTFLQARDGILSAAGILDPADLPVILKGFAKRGMGKSAKAPPSTSVNLTELVESFDES